MILWDQTGFIKALTLCITLWLQLPKSLIIFYLICFMGHFNCTPICCWSCFHVSTATLCQTTLTVPCGLRGRTSVFSYQARVEQVKQRPPRRSSSTMPSPAPLMITWLPLVTASYSQTLFWRYFTDNSNWTATTIIDYFCIIYVSVDNLKSLN